MSQKHDEYLEFLVWKGMRQRLDHTMDMEEFVQVEATVESQEVEYHRRILHEMDVIKQAGFSEYFLIVWDLLRFCRDAEIPVGPGRGSVCGSLIAYALYITDVDPIEFDIPFERFLHLERVAQPDIDLDLCQARRQEVIQYLVDKYGQENVAQIITYGTMQAKAVVKDVCRVLHVDDHNTGKHGNYSGEKLSGMIPEGSGADQVHLEEFIETEDGQKFKAEIEGLTVPFEGRTISPLDTALRLEGLRRHGSVHAAGVVIADRPIMEIAPLYRRNQESEVQIQYDMRDAEKIGLLKLDVLGLRTVTVLGDAEKLIQKENPDFRIKDVPLDDAPAFDLLQRGDTMGVFQLEGDGITAAVKGVKPDRFEDIIAILALYRPGPMEQLGTYIDRKHGEEDVTYLHPSLESILHRTYGLIVYQEQVMGIVRLLADYTPGEADMFRKAIGKKLPELIREEIEKFEQRARDKGMVPDDVIEDIGKQIAYFGRYGFNRGHATGYGFITYWTAYLKANYPTEFFTAVLNSFIGKTDRISAFVRAASKSGIRVGTPDINHSGRGFTTNEAGVIRFGLEGVKGLGASMVVDIIEERDGEEKNEYYSERVERVKDDGTPYKANVRRTRRVSNDPRRFSSYSEFCSRLTHIPVNAKEALVAAGAFDFQINSGADLLEMRGTLYEMARDLNKEAKKKNPGRVDTPIAVPGEIEMLRLEREHLGFYVTDHPLDLYEEDLERHGAVTYGDFHELPHRFKVAGIVVSVRTHQARNGQMAWVSIENEINEMTDITCFNNIWSEMSIEKDDIIMVRGKKSHHKKFGWSFIAEHVQKFSRRKADASSVLVTIPKTDITDLKFLSSMAGDEGAKLHVAMEDMGGRVALVRTDSYIELNRSAVALLAEIGEIRIGWRKNDPVVYDGEILERANSFYQGSGPARSPTWELPIVKLAYSLLGGQVIAEMKSPWKNQ